MSYTHKFEFKLKNLLPVEGEISFNNGEEPKFKLKSGEEMKVTQHKLIQELFEKICVIYKSTGGIEKIEIVEK